MRRNYYADDLEHDIVGTVPHDDYYISSKPVDLNALYMQVNRAGIVLKTPTDFVISRDDAYRYSLIHCTAAVSSIRFSDLVRQSARLIPCTSPGKIWYSSGLRALISCVAK